MAIKQGRYVASVIIDYEVDTDAPIERCLTLKVITNELQCVPPRPAFEPDGKMNYVGHMIMTEGLIQGLVMSIHQAHKHGFWKDHEHMEAIIKDLNKGFMLNSNELKIVSPRKPPNGKRQEPPGGSS